MLQTDGLAIGTGIAMTAATSPAIAVPAIFATTAQVPNVLSTDLGAAENVITAVGLSVGQISVDNRCIDVAGGVLTQNPSPGVAAPLGTPVNMTVSSGNDTRGNPCLFK
jgi:beta-lactam-binding protein with PASTA domain